MMTIEALAALLGERRAAGNFAPLRVSITQTVVGELQGVSFSGEVEVTLKGNVVLKGADITGIDVIEP